MTSQGRDIINKQKNISSSYLIPTMLLHLKEISTHGYELMQEVTKFGIGSFDKGNFYRTLRRLERDNLVTSTWETESSGPAKRIYSLTEAGKEYLDRWAETLEAQQRLLHQLLNLYTPFMNEQEKK